MNKKGRIYISAFVFIFCVLPLAWADTIDMKDGREEKGIVVENYRDRIMLSTVDGEKEIKKVDIKDILYDRHQQNLVKLGDFHQQKGNLIRAYTYFKKANQLDPEYKEARDKFIYLHSILIRRPEKQLRDDISRKQTFSREAGQAYLPEITERVPDSVADWLKDVAGLILVSEDEMPKIFAVLEDSPAQKAGLQKGDFIYSIWGRLTGYLDLSEIYNLIINSPSPEIMMAIKRKIVIVVDPDRERKCGGVGRIGFSVDIREEGLTVTGVKAGSIAATQGLTKGDLVTAIQGGSTRYLPLKDAVRYIDEAYSRGRVNLEVIKEATIWRKEL